MGPQKHKDNLTMTKVLHVIKPFFVMDKGDKFELNDNGMYESSYKEENHESDDSSCEVYSSYNSNYTISPTYAEMLIQDGYLMEDKTPKSTNNAPFVNVFDEIDTLLKTYEQDLENLDEDMADEPKALKVEKETVLNNLIKVLNHLKSVRR